MARVEARRRERAGRPTDRSLNMEAIYKSLKGNGFDTVAALGTSFALASWRPGRPLEKEQKELLESQLQRKKSKKTSWTGITRSGC